MIDDIELAGMNCYQDSRISCPACSDSRKKSKEKTLSITIDGSDKIYHCFHCEISGKISEKPYSAPASDPLEDFLKTPGQKNVIELPSATHDRELRDFMTSRGISEKTYKNFNVTTDIRWFSKNEGEQLAVGFVYGPPAEPSAVKWRSLKDKAFTQSGAAQTFYGLENLPEEMTDNPLVICEGELDALSFAEAGIPAVSVPNGAPAKFSRHDDGIKYNYLWEARELLERSEKIILPTDHDGPGDILKQELGRRIGLGKCYEVKFTTELKDANAVLCAEGADRLREIIEAATPMPLSGVYSANDYNDQVDELYEAGGTGQGLSTGFESLDNLITVAPGLYTVTGMPGHGKSAWIDAVMVNTAKLHGMRWAIASMENPVKIHVLKLASIYIGKPFFEGPTQRMSKSELREAMQWIDDHFVFLENRDGEVASLQSIIDRTKSAILRKNVSGLVIDPYNCLESKHESEHLGISEMLSRITSFSAAHQLSTWFVAHPTKQPYDAKSKPLDGNAIAGSHAWNSKSDVGVSLFLEGNDNQPIVNIWKSRFHWIAKRGQQRLQYHVGSGRFSDLPEENFDWDVT